MNNIDQKRESAKSLKTQGDYHEASQLFKTIWEETKDKWDGWNLAYCYNKSKQFEDALEISKLVYAIDKDFDFIKGTYAWSAFMLNINNYNGDNYDELKTYAEGILTLTKNKEEDVFRHLTILKMMD